MRNVLVLSLVLLIASPALAQDEPGFFGRLFGTDEATSDEEQGGLLESFIEDNLSGEGRQVSIGGFQGALSGRATLDSLTISDDQGAWLTLTDVVLDWSRAALFRGRLEVAELAAAEVLLPRLPTPATTSDAPTPEASGFSLPELPVSVSIDKIEVARAQIGQPVIGVEAAVSLAGGLQLEGGQGSATLAIQRLDGQGEISLDASYSNGTEVLALDLNVSEGPDGILASLIDLPGRPSVEFSIMGEAPVTAYAADIRLATDNAERLTGRVTTSQPQGTDDGTLQIVANVSGDIAPIFNSEYQPFFGPDVSLSTTVTKYPDGRLTISDLKVAAQSLKIDGAIDIGADGLPDVIRVTGDIASETGAVLLPLSGPETRVDRVDLEVSFDAARGDTWSGSFQIAGLDRPGFAAEELTLDGEGQIVSGPAQSVTAGLNFTATNLDLGNPNAAEALGEVVTGRARIDWTTDGPVQLRDLVIDGESYGLTGQADIAFREQGPAIEGRAAVRADRLSAFSGLAGRTLAGAVNVDTEFSAEPLAGFFDVSATGSSENLVVSQPEADAILDGTARLDVKASRNSEGISATLTTLETPNASLTGQATLKSGGSSLSLAGTLADAALLLPQVTGPVRLTASAEEGADRVWAWRTETVLTGTRLTAEGTATDIYGNPIIAASGRLEADDIADFAELAGRPLAGSITTDFAGEVAIDLSRASATLNGMATDLETGVPQADALLAGTVAFNIDAAMAGEVMTLRNSSVEGPELRVNADGTLVPDVGRFRFDGRISDASLLLQGAPSEPLDFTASARQDGRDWTFETAANGAGLSVAAEGIALDPTGETPAVDGQLRASAEDLSILSDLAGLPLSGRIAFDAKGQVTADLSRFDVNATANGSGLGIGQAQADQLLAGDLALQVDASRTGDAIDISSLSLTTNLLDISASGALAGSGSTVNLQARLADIATFVEGFSGPLDVTGTVGQTADGHYTVNLDANGPSGTQATTSGNITSDFSAVDVEVNGSAPLGLVNPFIAPRALSGTVGFDLSVNGPPALSSVSGQASSSGARLIAPTLGLALNDIAMTTTLNAGQANLSLSGSVENGGRLAVEGPIALTSPFNADLGITLNGVVLRDPRLYETTVDGRVSVSGPLTGGARIAGNLALGETNIRIPSSGLGGAGAVPEIIHLREPPPVRGTRSRAGLLASQNNDAANAGPGYPLDINVNAPSRIFIRGRGLESEFGGTLRITGDSNNVVPIGAFNLVRGRLDILGQRLALDEATVTIQGSFLPVVNIRASTQAEDYAINVNVDGPVADPVITFTSTPELPQEEVLARLIFGRGLDTLSPIQAARLALAIRTLAGRGGEGVVGKLRQGAGLADLDLTTDAQGNAAVRAGAYLGENVYTDVTVGATGETELNLNLDVSRSITLKGSVANTGDTSVGIFFERDY